MRLGPDLIYGSNPVTVRSLPKNKKRDDSTYSKVFQDFLRIAPDIFEETFLDDLVPNTPVQNNAKGVPRRKNTPETIQVGLGTVEEEREEEISEVRISSRGRIIRNTRKT